MKDMGADETCVARAGFMQSFEKSAVLKSADTQNVSTSAFTHSNGLAKRLVVAGLPVALLAACCLASFTGRTLHNLLHKADAHRVAANASQAKTVAGNLISFLNDDSVSPERLEFSEEPVFSEQHNRFVGDWSVVYRTNQEHQFLIRLSSTTQKVYGINRTRSDSLPLAIARPERREIITEEKAQMLALRYLKHLGIDTESISLQPESTVRTEYEDFQNSEYRGEGCYTFAYRRRTFGSKGHTLKVSIDRVTGELHYFWNPSEAR
ncbi:MAG: hypothetical protein H7145_04805 [Akkermansiaceae bacterium]|nr:hypothetical protein [Armatimonadota bacterium]